MPSSCCSFVIKCAQSCRGFWSQLFLEHFRTDSSTSLGEAFSLIIKGFCNVLADRVQILMHHELQEMHTTHRKFKQCKNTLKVICLIPPANASESLSTFNFLETCLTQSRLNVDWQCVAAATMFRIHCIESIGFSFFMRYSTKYLRCSLHVI